MLGFGFRSSCTLYRRCRFNYAATCAVMYMAQACRRFSSTKSVRIVYVATIQAVLYRDNMEVGFFSISFLLSSWHIAHLSCACDRYVSWQMKLPMCQNGSWIETQSRVRCSSLYCNAPRSTTPCEDYAGFCATTVKSKVDAKVTATNYAKKSW